MIRFSVGYQLRRDDGWMKTIIRHASKVHEVFFSPVGVANGRTGVPLPDGKFTTEEQQVKLRSDLCLLRDAQIPLNILYNASCYGKDLQSRVFFDRVVEQINFYMGEYDLRSVTTASPLIAAVVKKNFPMLLTRASINMGVSSILGMDYVSDIFDGFYIKQELNRNIPEILKMKDWCDRNDKQLFVLVNSGCLNDCAIHSFHNNQAAHSDELLFVDKRYPLQGCRHYLSRPEKLISVLRDANWIRPEDLHLYDGLFTAFKLATRINRNPERVLEAYVSEQYSGSILDLMEPNHEFVMRGRKLDNTLFPRDFGYFTGHCSRECSTCGYCDKVFQKALTP